jgi:hypothetical protein
MLKGLLEISFRKVFDAMGFEPSFARNITNQFSKPCCRLFFSIITDFFLALRFSLVIITVISIIKI